MRVMELPHVLLVGRGAQIPAGDAVHVGLLCRHDEQAPKRQRVISPKVHRGTYRPIGHSSEDADAYRPMPKATDGASATNYYIETDGIVMHHEL